jgi:peptidoglycan/xylan/chitin deacetylase (PgdA/CDA1 family)
MSRALLITINVHGIGPEAATQPQRELFGRDAHGRYAHRIGIARLLDHLGGAGLKATFFWPSSEAERMPALLERCLKDGHEIANHGHAFEDHMQLGEAVESALIEKAHDCLKRLTGAPPVGFRAPTGTLSLASIPILNRLGYRYDSSFLDDDHPYLLTEDGGPDMIELPFSEALSDAAHFGRKVTQERAEAHLTEELGGLLGTSGLGYACLSLHPRADIGIARSARLPILDRLVTFAQRHGASPVLCRDLAASVRSALKPTRLGERPVAQAT